MFSFKPSISAAFSALASSSCPASKPASEAALPLAATMEPGLRGPVGRTGRAAPAGLRAEGVRPMPEPLNGGAGEPAPLLGDVDLFGVVTFFRTPPPGAVEPTTAGFLDGVTVDIL